MKKKKQQTEWLDRTLTRCATCYCLCLSEKEFKREMRRLEVSFHQMGKWVGEGARTHLIPAREEHKRVAIVCLDTSVAIKINPVQVAAMLVHEAVHIWQDHAREIGSFNDHGDEEEAYAIQAIAQSLMEEYARRMI